MSSISSQDEFYVDGGTMRPDAGSYIERSADGELLKAVRAGEFCYILTCRQVGKSSLIARAAVKLRAEKIHAAIVELNQIGTETDDAEKSPGRWYYGLARRICRELGLGINLKTWWNERDDLPAIQRLTEFFTDVVLVSLDGPVVIFVDEIDTTINLPFTDDFFAAIRSCYNARAQTELGRLTFVLLGVASPDDLIGDRTRTPFNIGTRIELTDFTQQEAAALAEHLGEDAQARLNRILHWTGGHPYLTQKLCKAVAKESRLSLRESSATFAERKATMSSDDLVDGIVAEQFLTAGSDLSEDNLSYVRNRLIYHPRHSRRSKNAIFTSFVEHRQVRCIACLLRLF